MISNSMEVPVYKYIYQSFIQVIACLLPPKTQKMQPPIPPKQQPFITALISCSIDSNLQDATYVQPRNHRFFITDIKLVSMCQYQSNNGEDNQREQCQIIQLNSMYALMISRNPYDLPIVDVGSSCSEQGNGNSWESVIRDKDKEKLVGEFSSLFYFQRGVLTEHQKCVYGIEIYDYIQQQKIDEVTMPSLSDKSQLFHSYFKIQTQNMVKYVNFVMKSQIEIQQLAFKPQISSLFQRMKGELDVPNLAILCFPEGVRIFKKQTGFKFFGFVLTTDSAERYYCSSIMFSQKCQLQVASKLKQKYGIQNDKGIFNQKIFTIISEHAATQQTNKCLQYIYRMYLTHSPKPFHQKLMQLSTAFTVNRQSKRCQLTLLDYSTNFKLNSSYPNVSAQAVYAAFKFLDVQNIVTVVENLLLQRKIFMVSDQGNIRGMAIQAFLGFIYPLNWIHGIINPLASSMIEYTEAPMTIVFGISNCLAQKIKPQVDGLFVYLDKNKVQLRNSEQLSFSFNLRRQLIERLKQFSVYDFIDVRDYLNNPQNLSLFKTQRTQDPNFDAYKIRNIFFELTVFMLRNYKQYFIKNPSHVHHKSTGIKKYYNLSSLLHLYRKDPFMMAFFQTSLFSVLVEKKKQQPFNKWIKMLDHAIRKIASFKKHYIAEQSDIQDQIGDGVKVEDDQGQFVPKGCLNMISKMSKESRESDESKHAKSSPSPKNLTKIFEEQQKYSSPNKAQGRMSLPSEYQKRQNQIIEGNNYLSRLSYGQNSLGNDVSSQKSEKQTQKNSQNGDKSSNGGTPELQQNHQFIVYEFESDNQYHRQGVAYRICSIFSLPYKKMSNSVVSRWTRKKLNKIRSWKKKSVTAQQKITKQYQINMVQQLPQQPKPSPQSSPEKLPERPVHNS